jgi:hypothetical protein
MTTVLIGLLLWLQTSLLPVAEPAECVFSSRVPPSTPALPQGMCWSQGSRFVERRAFLHATINSSHKEKRSVCLGTYYFAKARLPSNLGLVAIRCGLFTAGKRSSPTDSLMRVATGVPESIDFDTIS